MKIYLDNNLGVTKVEQEELTQDTIGYNILKVYIPNAVLTPYNTFTCYYGALLQNGRKVGWFAMEARTNTDADYEANYTLYKATLEQCVVSVEGKVYIGCQILLGNSGNATLIKKNTAVVQFNVRKSVAINNDILVLDTDQTTTDVLESYKNLLKNALTTYATKATTYTKTEVNSALALKADKSDTYTKTQVDVKDLNLAAQMASDKVELNNRINTTNNILVETNARVTANADDIDTLEGNITTLQNNTYSKTEVDEKIDDISAYTKSEIDTMINAKADKTTVEGINTRVGALETDIADLESVQNVVDVVATKSALNSYDTSKLDVNDKVQVIADETHDGASTIYNWSGSAWVYVGAFGGNSYTKAETYNKTQIDSALSDKADKSDTYTRAAIDSMVLTLSTDKADKSNTYTKTEIDNTMQEVGQAFEIVSNEVEKKINAEYICKGNTTTQTTYSNTNPSKSTKVVLSKLGGMSYKCLNLLNEDVAKIDTWTIKLGTVNLQANVTYNLWSDVSFPDVERAVLKDNNGNTIAFSGWTFSGDDHFTLNFSYSGLLFLTGTFTTVKPTKFMLNTGSTALPYQPYFEGIRDSAVTQIRSMNGSTIVNSLSIPSYIRNIDGYGWGIDNTCYNYIDFATKKFVQKVGTRAYQSGDESDTSVITDGTTTYYELATPIETDISSYITKDTLEVVEGGTLEFLNTYNQAVPNEVAYIFNAVTLNNIVDSNGESVNLVSVVANPTLSGDEATLEGAEIDGIKYKVGGGGATLEDIVDSHGNKRFIEGDLTLRLTQEQMAQYGATVTYSKWSLSGTHLMIVACLSFTKKTQQSGEIKMFTVNLPNWIKEKIVPIFDNLISHNKVSKYPTGELVANLYLSNNEITINLTGLNDNPITVNCTVRYQFDLLIDAS